MVGGLRLEGEEVAGGVECLGEAGSWLWGFVFYYVLLCFSLFCCLC